MATIFVDVGLKLVSVSELLPMNSSPTGREFAGQAKARLKIEAGGKWTAITNAAQFRKLFGASSGTWNPRMPDTDLPLAFSGNVVAVNLNSYFHGGIDSALLFFERPAVLKMTGVAQTGFGLQYGGQPRWWTWWYRIWSASDMNFNDRLEYIGYRALKFHVKGAASQEMSALLTLQGVAMMAAILGLAAVAAVSPWAKLAAAIIIFLRSLGIVCTLADLAFYKEKLTLVYDTAKRPQIQEDDLDKAARAFAEMLSKLMVDLGMQLAGEAAGKLAGKIRQFFSSKNAKALMDSPEVAQEAQNYEQMLRQSGKDTAANRFVATISKVERCQGVTPLKGSVEAQQKLGLPRQVVDGYMEMCNAVTPPRVIVTRAGNPESLKFLNHPKARPKPMWLKWKNAKSGPFAGTVVTPSKESIIAKAREAGKSEQQAIKEFWEYCQKLEKQQGITIKTAPGAKPPDDVFGAQIQVNGNFFISDVDNQAVLIYQGGRWIPDPQWSRTMADNDSQSNQSLMNAFTQLAKEYNQHGAQMNSQWLNPVSGKVEAVRIGDPDEKYLIICPGLKLFQVGSTQDLYSALTTAFGVSVDARGGRVLPPRN